MTTTEGDERSRALRVRRSLASIRTRILTSYVLLLALATLVSMFVAREVLLNRLDERIDRELLQETAELRRLSGGNDPETGRPFGTRVRRILAVFMQRSVPSENETMLTFINGEPFLRSPDDPSYRVDLDPELVERWSDLDGTDRGRVETPAGDLDFLAVPLEIDGRPRGVFVVGLFRAAEEARVNSAVSVASMAALAILLIGSLLAWNLAERILGRVRIVTGTARTISETDLMRRIEVGGNDEISQLAQTFNEMLDRLELAFATQRRFASDAGHELRTPITVVRGHLEVMGDDPEERAETVALVLDELDRMHRIVEELLVLARAEQPNFLRLESVDLDLLTTEVFAKAGTLAPGRWHLESSGRGWVIADRQRVTQAVMQLAQNAVDYAPSGALVLGSSLHDGSAHVWVRDEGPGIPAEQHESIFTRFARGPDGPRRSEGAGLGLSIVKVIAEAHNGRVELDSEPGKGSKFTIVLPVDQPYPTERMNP